MRYTSGLFVLILFTSPAISADPSRAIAKLIDRSLAADWAVRGIHPAPLADDATFHRRACLDLIGRIPQLEETQAFLADRSLDKREKLLDRLLTSHEHAIHLASVTRVEWMPQSLGNFRLQFAGAEFEGWLETQFRKNVPFDRIIRSILEAPAIVGQRGMVSLIDPKAGERQALSAFYEMADGKPEEMAAASSRLFLGIKLECAQCHDHPFAPYSREQFWEFAAFFGEFTPLSPVEPSFVGPLTPQYEANRITIPNTSREVMARYFTGGEPVWKSDRSPRKELADWLTGPGQPLFARNLANRLWGHFFGIGLIDPIDEPGETNPPSHPAILSALTDAVIQSKYDIRIVLKGIALSQAYQLSAELTHPTQADPKRFARMIPKGLTGHQIFDSLNTAAGQDVSQAKENTNSRRLAANEAQGGSRGEFVARFPQTNRRNESATSILQSLMLMNGRYVNDMLKDDKNPLLARLRHSNGSNDEAVETLFLAVFSRMPTTAEREQFTLYLDSGGPTENRDRALGDLFWVLVNGTEFLLNH